MSFILEYDRPSESPLIERVWRVRSGSAGSFISSAASQSEMVFSHYRGEIIVTARGPETQASHVDFPADAEWFGITFGLGTYMSLFSPAQISHPWGIVLPQAGSRSFWLDGSVWKLPTYDNADVFIRRLERAGLLTHDPIVPAVLSGQPHHYSRRAVQYRFQRATGLTHKLIQQIDRARRASELLTRGTSILDTATTLGYFDQAHLTNALKRFLGQTPTQIARLSSS
jgi:hypothetical protein